MRFVFVENFGFFLVRPKDPRMTPQKVKTDFVAWNVENVQREKFRYPRAFSKK